MTNTATASVVELRERIRRLQTPALDARTLPTHPVIGRLLPGGALREGASYSVDSSLTLTMLLLAAPSTAGIWCGVIGVPEFGVEAAAGFGIDLQRLVLIPEPGDQWLTTTAALADALGVIVVRPPRRTSDASAARLSARLRKRGATLLVLGSHSHERWPHTEAMLSMTENSWAGVDSGHGHLQARDATITVTHRAHGRPRSARVHVTGVGVVAKARW